MNEIDFSGNVFLFSKIPGEWESERLRFSSSIRCLKEISKDGRKDKVRALREALEKQGQHFSKKAYSYEILQGVSGIKMISDWSNLRARKK